MKPTGCATAPRSAAAAQPGGQVLPGEFLLRDGTPALIWPLLPTDAETLRDGFRRLSSESRQHRFLTVLGELDDSMIRRLVGSVDGGQHIALLLIVLPPEGEEGPVGVARLLQYADDPATADIAVTVVDDWQGRGAGTALVSALLERRPAAVTRLCTVIEADNRASLALLAGAGRISSGLPYRGVIDVTVELAGPARPARAPTPRPVTPIPSSIVPAPPFTRLLRGYSQRVAEQLGLSSTVVAVPAIVWCLCCIVACRRARIRLSDAMSFDPEYVGSILRMGVPATESGDFQDIPLWRKLVADFALGLSAEYRRTLIVPMTLVNPQYRAEIFGLITKTGETVLHVFLDVTADELRRRTNAQEAA